MDHKYYGDVAANRIVQLRNYLNIFLALNKDQLNAQLISEFLNFWSEIILYYVVKRYWQDSAYFIIMTTQTTDMATAMSVSSK